MTRTSIACLACALVLPGLAADDAPRRKLIEQKAALVQKMLEDSPVTRRVASGGSDEAKANLSRAAQAHRRGLGLAAEGRLDEGEAAMDEAMSAIASATRLAPDPARATAALRERYAAQAESARAVLAAARRREALRPGPAPDEEIERGARLIDQADRLAAQSQYAEALRPLAIAEHALLQALVRMLGTTTVDYTARFDTPEEELRHEGERFAGYQRLVPVATAGLKPAPRELAIVDEYVHRAVQLRDESAARASRGEMPGALEALKQGTDWLQRALAAAGLVLPTP